MKTIVRLAASHPGTASCKNKDESIKIEKKTMINGARRRDPQKITSTDRQKHRSLTKTNTYPSSILRRREKTYPPRQFPYAHDAL